MYINKKKELLKAALQNGNGIFQLAPTWVPRLSMIPGRRLKLDPRDIYALGAHRGGINERWFASTVRADNGPDTPEDEGLSYIVIEHKGDVIKILLKEAIEIMGEEIIGKEAVGKYGGWTAFAKFFDNMGPIPHHVHLMDKHAEKIGKTGKPEAYYFPVQLNSIENNFPYAFFGLETGTTKDDVIKCLKSWYEGDNGILKLSKAYKLIPDTGWDVPSGILHAPGSLLTYETQKASDVCLTFQSMVEGRYISRESLIKDLPGDKYNDYEYMVDILDWDLNIDPEFIKNRFREPIPDGDVNEMKENGYMQKQVIYGSTEFSAKELTVFPGATIKIKDEAAYGFILIQGYGTINSVTVETPAIIRYGQNTSDEMFVANDTAHEGVTISNKSRYDNLVMLKHFGPKT